MSETFSIEISKNTIILTLLITVTGLSAFNFYTIMNHQNNQEKIISSLQDKDTSTTEKIDRINQTVKDQDTEVSNIKSDITSLNQQFQNISNSSDQEIISMPEAVDIAESTEYVEEGKGVYQVSYNPSNLPKYEENDGEVTTELPEIIDNPEEYLKPVYAVTHFNSKGEQHYFVISLNGKLIQYTPPEDVNQSFN